MLDYDLFELKTSQYINILFPDFETCKKYYYDSNLDSSDLKTKLLSMYLKISEEKIKNFNFENYINEENHQDLYNYIKNFLPQKFQETGTVIFNTLAQKILQFSCKNEQKLQENQNLFDDFLKEEVNRFLKLIKSFQEENDYLFYTNDIFIEKGLEEEKVLDNLVIKKGENSPIFLFQKINFNINLYYDFEALFVKSLTLIFGEKINFFQFADTHTLSLKNYGCDNIVLYPINNWQSFLNPYSCQLIPLGQKVILNNENFEIFKSLLSQYLNIIKALEDNDYKKISLDFYMDSLNKIGTAKITYSVIAIESLFNVNRTDIKMNFVQRGVKLLQSFYEEKYWEEIENDFEQAYKIRCDYTHGTKQKHPNATIDLTQRISQYTRLILVVFLELSHKIETERQKINEKKYINEKLIDKSLLYPEINKHFCELLKDIIIYIQN